MRPLPDDFAEHAQMSQTKLKAHYKASIATVSKWIAVSGIKREKLPVATTPPPPEDYAEVAGTLTISEARRHYGKGAETIARWDKVCGIRRKSTDRSRTYQPPRPRLRVATPPVHRGIAPVDRPTRDTSPAGEAADYLRRFGPVYRCNDAGAPCIGGEFWRRGSSTPLTDAQLIERADWNRSRENRRIAA